MENGYSSDGCFLYETFEMFFYNSRYVMFGHNFGVTKNVLVTKNGIFWTYLGYWVFMSISAVSLKML